MAPLTNLVPSLRAAQTAIGSTDQPPDQTPPPVVLRKFQTGGWADNLPPHAYGPFDKGASRLVPPGTLDKNEIRVDDQWDTTNGRMWRQPRTGKKLPTYLDL